LSEEFCPGDFVLDSDQSVLGWIDAARIPCRFYGVLSAHGKLTSFFTWPQQWAIPSFDSFEWIRQQWTNDSQLVSSGML